MAEESEIPSSPEHVVSAIPDTVNARQLCRLWRQAIVDVGGSAAAPQQLPPWVVLPDGCFLTCTDGRMHFRPASFPDNATCVGSTNGWLALVTVNDEKRHSYMLYNPFSETTVSLPELDAIIGVVPKSFRIRKVLMRSTPDDVVVVMPNNVNYPIILVRPGRGVWVPKPKTSPFTRIIDVAFLGDKLYGITQAEDLFALDIDFDADGVPMVTSTRGVIGSSTEDDDYDVWSYSEESFVDDEDYDESGEDHNDDDIDGDDDIDDNNNDDDDEDDEEETGEDNKYKVIEDMLGELDLDEIQDGIAYTIDYEATTKPKDYIITIWYLVESRGTLLMVRRTLQCPPFDGSYTRTVEIFEADMGTCVWVPVTNELGGHTLFMSKSFSKSVPAVRESEEDAIHFIDTRDTFNMKFQTTIPSHCDRDYCKLVWKLSWSFFGMHCTWLFPLEPVDS
jgi:hypothetical protein